MHVWGEGLPVLTQVCSNPTSGAVVPSARSFWAMFIQTGSATSSPGSADKSCQAPRAPLLGFFPPRSLVAERALGEAT